MDYTRYFNYDAASGSLSWKPRNRNEFLSDWHFQEHLKHCNKSLLGKRFAKGRPICIMVNTRKQGLPDRLAHRIIWQMHNGPIPSGMVIDHINGDPFDNRLENLRLCTQYGNMRNSRRHKVNNHRVKGVSWDKSNKKWQTEIRTDVGRVFIGRFPTKGLAAVAYAKASLRYHGSFSTFAR